MFESLIKVVRNLILTRHYVLLLYYFRPDFKKPTGPTGKSPWITDDDGQAVSDSQLVIEHLMRKHNIQVSILENFFFFVTDEQPK